MRRIAFALPGVLMAAVLTVWAAPASAATISFFLSVDGCTGGCGTAPFGQVDLNDFGSAGDVQVTVTLFNGNKFVQTGSHDTFVWDLNGVPAITETGLRSDFSSDSTSATEPGSIHDSTFGFFEYGVNDNLGTGGSHAVSGQLRFDVLSPGITVGTFLDLSNGGSPSAYFAADILSGTTGNTGPVGATTPCGETGIDTASIAPTCTPQPFSTVPEPGSLVLLGSGLLFATRSIRRRFGL